MATIDQVAQALNLSPRRVQSLVAQEGMPRVKAGQYDLGACLRWYVRYLQKVVKAQRDPDEVGDVREWTRERARLAKEQADKTALDNAVKRGELVEMAVVAEEWSRYFQAFRGRFVGFPAKVAAELAALTGGDASTIRGRLDAEVDEWLAAFHRPGGSAVNNLDG